MDFLYFIGFILFIWIIGSFISGWNSAKENNQENQFRRPDVNATDYSHNIGRSDNVSTYSFINDKFGYLIRFDHSQELINRKSSFQSLTLNDGKIYEGEVSNGIMDGFGTLSESDGTTIQGFWIKGKKNGIMIIKNENILRKSTYKDDVLHGLSYYDDLDGNYHYLEYNNGNLVKLFQKYPNGVITKII